MTFVASSVSHQDGQWTGGATTATTQRDSHNDQDEKHNCHYDYPAKPRKKFQFGSDFYLFDLRRTCIEHFSSASNQCIFTKFDAISTLYIHLAT